MNVLLFTADDMNFDTPTVFGGRYGPATPHLDAFAQTARCFRHAHVTVAVCLPSRSVLLTGRYPHHNGSEGFTAIHPTVPTLPEWLKDQHGWRSGIIGKVKHCCPPEKFRWDHQCDYEDLGFGRDPQRYAAEVDDFLSRREDNQPFFLMLNSHDPHRPFHGGPQEAHKWSAAERAHIPPPSRVIRPDEVTVPGFLPDIPEVRQEVAEYASSCRRCDDTFAATLASLERHGVLEDTVIIFLSDNGMAFPFAKTNCYLHSTRTPLMIRWPGRTAPGMDEEHMVSGIDLLPTLIAGLGLDTIADLPHPAWLEPLVHVNGNRWRSLPPTIDGRSFLPLIEGAAQDGRDHVHTVFHATHQGQRYEMRCVQTRDWGYIWNHWSDGKLTFRNESCSGRTFQAMRNAAEANPAIADRVQHFLHRCPEELYYFKDDPDALDNRIEQDGEVADALRHRMRQWMQDTDDILITAFQDRAP